MRTMEKGIGSLHKIYKRRSCFAVISDEDFVSRSDAQGLCKLYTRFVHFFISAVFPISIPFLTKIIAQFQDLYRAKRNSFLAFLHIYFLANEVTLGQ